jgi:hypothetical protein
VIIVQPFHYYLDFGVQVGHANQSLPAVRERDEVREALRPGNCSLKKITTVTINQIKITTVNIYKIKITTVTIYK